jgi:hypothetical protein
MRTWLIKSSYNTFKRYWKERRACAAHTHARTHTHTHMDQGSVRGNWAIFRNLSYSLQQRVCNNKHTIRYDAKRLRSSPLPAWWTRWWVSYLHLPLSLVTSFLKTYITNVTPPSHSCHFKCAYKNLPNKICWKFLPKSLLHIWPIVATYIWLP